MKIHEFCRNCKSKVDDDNVLLPPGNHCEFCESEETHKEAKEITAAFVTRIQNYRIKKAIERNNKDN